MSDLIAADPYAQTSRPAGARGRDGGPNDRPSWRSERRGSHRAADLGGGAL